MDKPEMAPPLVPPNGRPYNPVATLNGWTLPWRMKDGWKEFHLVAEPVRRQMAPGMTAQLWGYNGQSPGPTIECVEGDKVRIFVTNKLPEHTTIHWHGILLPNGMDGVGGLTQPQILVGKTYVYEFQMKKSGTFMYHPHADEMVQMAMGMMGFLVVHPKDPKLMRLPRHRSSRRAQRRPRANPHGKPHHDQSSDPPARLRPRGHGNRWRMGAEVGALARGDDRCRRGADARDRIQRERTGRLGVPLPQVAPHHERHGPRRTYDDRRGPPRRGGEDHAPGARLHGDG
jgi:hypothetical protein